ncbi:plastocyanin [Paucibacter sp. KBW04]|uniref:cupredoxin domain-containing protein n=1 Tax=Paucibacter sp. KBW04 TaxID=2153361 RepID=UPI000F56CEFE|nr:cupredoxin family protein [Paucibacter sp. KBW04]RQO61214.1 plastocyanin [Paucibacter sp. KBW04]
MNTSFKAKRLAATALLALPLLALPSLSQAHGEAHAQDQPLRLEQTDWGIAAPAQAATRTVNFRMNDQMRFSPDRLEVKQGETLRLRIKNEGAVMHEFVLGTKAQLDAHAAMMLKHPGMEHDEPYMAHVAPGQTGEIVWTFNRAGEFDFACLIAGHYQAGMVGKVIVKAQASGKTHSH